MLNKSTFERYGMQRVSCITTNQNYNNNHIKVDNIYIDYKGLEHMANIIKDIFKTEKLFESHIIEKIPKYFIDFYTKYVPRLPKKFFNCEGSTTINGLLPLYIIGKCINPSTYIESGVFIGSSLRMFTKILPKADIYAYDISFKALKFHDEHVNYFENEWTLNIPNLTDSNNTLAFFDDHIDAVRRIKECFDLGIQWIIFDDSPTLARLSLYRYPCIPSIPLIMDENLPDGMTIQWKHSSFEEILTYKHDLKYCQLAKSYIQEVYSLRDIFSSIGIDCGDKYLVKLK